MAGIVLLSGGLDSTVALALYREADLIELALTFAYGQKAQEQEVRAASRIAEFYGVRHEVIHLPFLHAQTKTALVDGSHDLPELDAIELDDAAGRCRASAAAVWVPNRNGLFLNIAAVFAENLPAPCALVAGFNREEAATFPDNSPEFIAAVNRSLQYSTRQDIRVVSPTVHLKKEEIVHEALRLKVPLDLVWSCYRGGGKPCGRCESCLRLRRALLANSQLEVVGRMFQS